MICYSHSDEKILRHKLKSAVRGCSSSMRDRVIILDTRHSNEPKLKCICMDNILHTHTNIHTDVVVVLIIWLSVYTRTCTVAVSD